MTRQLNVFVCRGPIRDRQIRETVIPQLERAGMKVFDANLPVRDDFVHEFTPKARKDADALVYFIDGDSDCIGLLAQASVYAGNGRVVVIVLHSMPRHVAVKIRKDVLVPIEEDSDTDSSKLINLAIFDEDDLDGDSGFGDLVVSWLQLYFDTLAQAAANTSAKTEAPTTVLAVTE